MDDDGDMDALFNSFMDQVTNIKSNKMKKLEEKTGSPEEIVERLTSKSFEGLAFEVLQLSPEASESDITKTYRKMSVLIHPDKCKLEGAADAFQVLSKAYTDTKDPAYQDKYRGVYLDARDRVRKRVEKENQAREKRGEEPLDTQGNDFDREVLRECEAMTTEGKERAEYKNEVLEANMKRMEEQAKAAREARREEAKEKRQWDKQRDKRVAGWQTFMSNVESKKFKTGHFVGKVGAADIHFKREQRKDDDDEKQTAGKATIGEKTGYKKEDGYVPMGIDKSYKKIWR